VLRYLPFAIKLVAFGEVALIQLGKGSTHTTAIYGRGRIVKVSARLLVTVAYYEPIMNVAKMPTK